MKKIFFCMVLTLSISNISLIHAQGPIDWVKQNPSYIMYGVAGLLIGISYVVPKLIQNYFEREFLQAREQAINNVKQINTVQTSNNQVNQTIKENLIINKKALKNTWKLNWQLGINISGFVTLGGYFNFNASRIISLAHLIIENHGILKQSFSLGSTIVNGNIIAQSCQFKGDIFINSPSFTSFKHCILHNIKVDHGIIELKDCIVTGDIVFHNNSGFVVLDNKSIISGSIINGVVQHK